MLGRISALMLHTFREAIRGKILYTILFFAGLLIVSSWALGQLSLAEEARVARDLGLGGISFFGVVLGALLGVNLLHRDIERRTIQVILARPVRRGEYLVGRFAGLALALAVVSALMTAVLWITLRAAGAGLDGLVARAVILLYLQTLVVTALAVLFSTLSTPIVSSLMTFGLFVVGRSIPDLLGFVDARLEPGPARTAARVFVELLPDLHVFFVSGQVVGGPPAQLMSVHGPRYVDWAYVAWAGGYTVVYIACALALATLVFSRRDLT